MRTVYRFPALALAAAFLAAGGACTTDPDIQGSTRMVVGQRVTLELEQGPVFLNGELSLTDGEGFTYEATDPLLAYTFESEKRVVFTVPYGIAAGIATVSVGAQGRDPYVFPVEIIRLFGVLSGSGRLAFHDLASPGQAYGTAQVGVGDGTLGLSARGDRLVAVTQESGEVHFLEIYADALTPFAPSINLGFPLKRGALVETGALVAAERGVAYIEQRGDGQLVLDEWLDTGPVDSIAAAADEGRAVAVGTTTDASPVNVLLRLNVAVRPPEISPPTILLGGSAGGLADVAVTPEGDYAVVVNTLDEQLTLVNLLQPGQAPLNMPVPLECLAPTRIVMARRGNFLGVVCSGSKNVAVFAVEAGGIASLGTVAPDTRTDDPALAKDPVDLGFAPPRQMLVLLSDGALTSVDLTGSPPALTRTALRDVQESAGMALVVQP